MPERSPLDSMTYHESAVAHVTGEALYVDDIPTVEQTLVGKVVYSPHAHARILNFDLSHARRVHGIHAVLSYRDIPGVNQMGPVVKDELCLAEEEIVCCGQAVFLIAGDTDEQCREAERLIAIEYQPLEAILDLPSAMEKDSLLGPPRTMRRGDVDAALTQAQHRVSGELRTGAQEHWYLETQACLCIPGEGAEMMVYSSTQHPSETQTLVADVLGIHRNEVVVEVRRLGGAFGGKETQANHTACWTALLARATGAPVKIRLCRDDDMIITGKRHRYLIRYEVGFDDDGTLQAVRMDLNADGGCATDLSFAILERAMLHADNAYFVPHFEVTGRVWRTHLPSNTAMRGFGGPQAMAAMETIIDRVARVLQLDPAKVRRRNFYGIDDRDVTHYGQTVEHNRLQGIFEKLMATSDYASRRAEVARFNATHEFEKKGIALTPVKFGISFTTTFLNQAGALVHIYTDGSVMVSHGGIEMGQGLHTKIGMIAAHELGLSGEDVNVVPTNTGKVPNTSATAASSGTDLNGMAVKNAIDVIKARIAPPIARLLSANQTEPTRPEDIHFENRYVVDLRHPDRRVGFAQAMNALYLQQVSLSAAGYYRTPTIGWDKLAGKGKPFYYYAFGMAVAEVTLDVLTGSHVIDRVDILHDAGNSLNPGIDLGQVEGGFLQGVGWCTTEEIMWDAAGRLMTHSPDTYKIPTAGDLPHEFRVALLKDAPNEGTIRNSKAVGEPPFMLALSVWLALKDAVASAANNTLEPEFALPATNELLMLSADRLRSGRHQAEA